MTNTTWTRARAYRAGWASSLTGSEWDEAAARFDAMHPGETELQHAWMDGWSDRVIGQDKGHALKCDADDHDKCSDTPDDFAEFAARLAISHEASRVARAGRKAREARTAAAR